MEIEKKELPEAIDMLKKDVMILQNYFEDMIEIINQSENVLEQVCTTQSKEDLVIMQKYEKYKGMMELDNIVSDAHSIFNNVLSLLEKFEEPVQKTDFISKVALN